MVIHASQVAEKFTQSLISILGEPNVRNLIESHVNRSMDSIDDINPDSLDKHIGALSERSALEMIQKFPNLLQERIQSPRESKLDESGRPGSNPTHGQPFSGNGTGFFNGGSPDWGLETKPSFEGSQASTLVHEPEPYQAHYSPGDEPKRGIRFPNSPFIPERAPPTQSRRGVELSNSPFIPGGPTYTQSHRGVGSFNAPFIPETSPPSQPNRDVKFSNAPLIPERPPPTQTHRGVGASHLPSIPERKPPAQPNRDILPFTSGGPPPAKGKLDPISELGEQNQGSNRNKASQMAGYGSTTVDSATSYLGGLDGKPKEPPRNFPTAYSNHGPPLSIPIRPSTTARESYNGAPSLEIKNPTTHPTTHPITRDESPLDRKHISQFEERPLTPDSGTTESEYVEQPLTPLSDNSEQIYAEVTSSPQKSQEYLSQTIENTGLSGFYDKDHPRVQTVAINAAARAARISSTYELTPKTTLGVIKLALYNFVILCDDSGSMKQENRIPALKTTLMRVVEIATLLEETGISIRFLNYSRDSRLDDLRRPEDIVQKVASVRWKGITKLGNMLQEKIIQPMIIDKVKRRTFETPLIVVIITDGEPYGEHRETLRDKIRQCKQDLSGTDFGDGSVVFIISRVGSSPESLGFIRELENSPGLEEMVYCSPDRLDEQMAILQPAAGNTKYTKYVSSVTFPLFQL
ncbi:hypothetical protein AYL99_04584 [Fonsecaea erecta]|uniref:VWFA domain-containing protein n=1 Tax=Fonsecaea erecta TaxID=1367422 RepID=A0A178ZSG5_9EURO|nr:hypothetical protein AYL99_04584 [Fonsecaea erecta]OAP62381.1 hypothetical protein AYL99_04584 [Fonsecaea erecta]